MLHPLNFKDFSSFFIYGKEIGIFLTESGDIHAINNICPHKQGPLSEGTVSHKRLHR
jgi:nitrite reductase/ring-hydroxylating ferredoxin subunit